MLRLEIAAFVTKKPVDDGMASDFWVSIFEVYPLGKAFRNEPLSGGKRQFVGFDTTQLEVGYRDTLNPELALWHIFEVATYEGGANPNAIDKVTLYKGIDGNIRRDGEWDKVWTWVRGQPLPPKVKL